MKNTMPHPRSAAAAALLLLLASLGGCASYQLKGTVVEGSGPGIFIVDPGDPRLKNTGVADAQVQAILDADKLRTRMLPAAMSDDYGRFAIPVDEPGAGLLEYTVALYCEADGFGTPPGAGQAIALPPPGKQVLIVLSAGRRTGPRPPAKPTNDDLINEAEKFKKQFE
jgi:hypothetical protein